MRMLLLLCVRRPGSRALRRSARRSTRDRVGWNGPGARGATGCSGRWSGSERRRALREPLRELGAAAFEERDAIGWAEVPAERELQREGALVVGLVVGEELGEGRPARVGDPVRLAGAAGRGGPGAAGGPRRGRRRDRAGRDERSTARRLRPRRSRRSRRRAPTGAAPDRASRTRSPRAGRASRRGASSARSRGGAGRRGGRARRVPTWCYTIYRIDISTQVVHPPVANRAVRQPSGNWRHSTAWYGGLRRQVAPVRETRRSARTYTSRPCVA